MQRLFLILPGPVTHVIRIHHLQAMKAQQSLKLQIRFQSFAVPSHNLLVVSHLFRP